MIEASRKVLEEKIGYRFKDRYLLECALTHTSFANEQKIQTFRDYERIEFLGDAVLEMISSDFLFRTYPEKKRGSSLSCAPLLYVSQPWLIVPEICHWVRSSALEKEKRPAEAGKRIRSYPMSWKPLSEPCIWTAEG